jgi:hypothetical protein
MAAHAPPDQQEISKYESLEYFATKLKCTALFRAQEIEIENIKNQKIDEEKKKMDFNKLIDRFEIKYRWWFDELPLKINKIKKKNKEKLTLRLTFPDTFDPSQVHLKKYFVDVNSNDNNNDNEKEDPFEIAEINEYSECHAVEVMLFNRGFTNKDLTWSVIKNRIVIDININI